MSVRVVDCEQGSEEWFAAKCGVPSASEFHSILAKGEGKVRKSYMLRLAAERYLGRAVETFKSKAMDRGKRMEPEARDLYAFTRDVDPVLVGFIRNGEVGCSPDSLIGDDGLLEIKTKEPDLLIERLLIGNFPPEHVAQCQGALWVAEREWIDIAVYWPGMPLYVKRATRDDKYIAVMAAEVARFNAELVDMVERVRAYAERGDLEHKLRASLELVR